MTDRDGSGSDAVSTPAYKILGHQTDASGTTYGVTGQVDSPDGFGLHTPDDLKVGGAAEATGDWTVRAGDESTGDAANVVAGHASNGVDYDPVGATIGGGGFDDGNDFEANVAYGDYAVVAGGRNNQAGAAGNTAAPDTTVGGGDTNTANREGATVAGGTSNDATGDFAVVAGGFGNAAQDYGAVVAGGVTNTTGALTQYATIGGGRGNEANGEYATVGGGEANEVDASHATVGGGGSTDSTPTTGNAVTDDYGTVAGGGNNRAGDAASGSTNATFATVGGGELNEAGGEYATVGGGFGNLATAGRATVAGGENNEATGDHATVPGGDNNTASGKYSLAAGRGANTGGHDGSFVWADSSVNAVSAGGADEFVVQAGGGATVYSESDTSTNTGVTLPSGSGSWSSLSARAAKSNVSPADSRAVLAGVEELDVATWEYDAEDGVDHMGPMAGAFHEQFGLGGDERRISNVDADGVALAAIQGLAERLDDEVGRLEAETDDLRAENDRLREHNRELAARLAAVEERLGVDQAADVRQEGGEQ